MALRGQVLARDVALGIFPVEERIDLGLAVLVPVDNPFDIGRGIGAVAGRCGRTVGQVHDRLIVEVASEKHEGPVAVRYGHAGRILVGPYRGTVDRRAGFIAQSPAIVEPKHVARGDGCAKLPLASGLRRS